MDTDKVLTRIAVAVPLAHVVACSLFLSGYSFGFGDQIGGLFELTDFFGISIQHLAGMYLLGFGIPLLMITARHRSGFAYAQDVREREPDSAKKATLERRDLSAKRVVTVVSSAMAMVGIVMITISQVFDTSRMYFIAMSLIATGISPLWWVVANSLRFHGLPAELTWIVASAIIGIIALGMDLGHIERRYSYEILSLNRYGCASMTILRPLGSRFLAVSPDGQRHIINEKCEVVFSFPAKPKLNTRPITSNSSIFGT